jgi:hypothetical protein
LGLGGKVLSFFLILTTEKKLVVKKPDAAYELTWERRVCQGIKNAREQRAASSY